MGKYWTTRWQEKEQALRKAKLENFRERGNPLGRGIVNQGIGDGECRELIQALEPWKMKDSGVGKPATIEVGGIKVSRASVEFAYMASTIAEHMNLKRSMPISVLEIGGGFGGLAWSLSLQTSSILSYVFVDHPVHLKIQQYFTDRALGSMTRAFWTRKEFTADMEKPDHRRYDLATCTRAFGEMSIEEADEYCYALSWCVKPGGFVYLVTWEHKIIAADDLKFPETYWEIVVDRPWPHAKMVERMYRRKGA